MASEDFSGLLQKAEELCSTFDTDVELPRVDRSLQQILEAGQKLWSKSQHAASEDAVNVKAATLLGPKGYGIPQISQKLESLSSVKTYEALEPVQETDVRAFLKNERDNALLAAIESTKKRTFAEAESRHWESMRDEWEREKQRLLNTLLGSQQDSTIDFSLDQSSMMGGGAADMSMSALGTHRSAMDPVELAYAKQIYIYNDDVIAGGTVPPLLLKMMEVADTLGDEQVKGVWDMVEAVSAIATQNLSSDRNSQRLHESIVSCSIKHLEKSYLKHVQQVVNRNLQKAMLGGIPGTKQLVKSYLKIILSQIQNPGFEDEPVEGHPVWPMIYYCLRCGDLQAAADIAQQAVAPNVREFSVYIREYASHGHLTETSVRNMKYAYRKEVRNSLDPFKRVVYCVMGCCNLEDAHSEVAEKIDDYLWLRLTQIQSSSKMPQGDDVITLPKLQTQLLIDWGESHFQAQQRPYLYFPVLLLTGQFEAAIEFLSRHDRLLTHAVHIALVLYELKLIQLPSNIQTHLLSRETSDTEPLRRINLARLVVMYTRKFEVTDPREALQYFYFLRNMKSSKGENLFISCVSELVLNTREFDMLLGKMERNGKRKPGAIDKFQSDTKNIIDTVALNTEKKGMFEEAVSLYDLAQSHEKAVRLLNQLVSRHISEPSMPGSSKERISTVALEIAKRYKGVAEMSKPTSGTFYLLLDLMLFFDQYHGEQYDSALDIIRQLKILPMSLDMVEQKVNSFKYYEEEIRQSLPDVLLSTMNILLNMYKKNRPVNATGGRLGQSASLSFVMDDGGRNTTVTGLRENARALITFAGMMPYRLPGDTSARLVQMEVLMN